MAMPQEQVSLFERMSENFFDSATAYQRVLWQLHNPLNYKTGRMGLFVEEVAGVKQIENEVRVLPLSTFDDQIPIPHIGRSTEIRSSERT